MTDPTIEETIEEANYLFPSLAQGLEKIGDNGVPFVSDKTGLDWLRTKLTLVRDTARSDTIKECQKEMYKALEEVAQYGSKDPIMLVNKADLKVWIHALTNIAKGE